MRRGARGSDLAGVQRSVEKRLAISSPGLTSRRKQQQRWLKSLQRYLGNHVLTSDTTDNNFLEGSKYCKGAQTDANVSFFAEPPL